MTCTNWGCRTAPRGLVRQLTQLVEHAGKVSRATGNIASQLGHIPSLVKLRIAPLLGFSLLQAASTTAADGRLLWWLVSRIAAINCGP